MRNSLRRLAVTLSLFVLLLPGAGCVSDSPTGPDTGSSQQTPVLPAAQKLDFNYSFFTEPMGKGAEATRQNYFNARIRVAIVQVVTEFMLTPPVAAFALAIHSVPSLQDDGSYIWTYTWVNGSEEAQIRLRGLPKTDRVEWELRVTAPHENPPIDNRVWFEGETRNDGETGFFRFHDFKQSGEPVVARIDWDSGPGFEELAFTGLDDNPGDKLSYRMDGAEHEIEYVDASASDDWFVRWNSDTGAGSVKAPDYNDGQEACWDERQEDAPCPGIS